MYLRRRTCVSHREELFRILAVAGPAQRLGRRKLEVERGVLAMRLDVPVAPCASRGGFGGVLFMWLTPTKKLLARLFAHLLVC